MKNLKIMKKGNRKNKESGITLIALVVTIIVLLILAGISIMMLTGDNGILTNASKASSNTAYRGAEERVKLAYTAVQTQIMAEKVKNSSYDARTLTDMEKLANLVENDLNGSGWTVKYQGIADSNANKEGAKRGVIYIEYKDSKIDKGAIDNLSTPQVPAEEGYVHYKIIVDKQSAKLEIDTDTEADTFNSFTDGGITTYEYSIPATGIVVDKETEKVGIDDTVTLTATLTPEDSTATITWVIVEGGSYVTFDAATGKVTGKTEGDSKVKIKAKAVNADGTEIESSNTCTITVEKSPYIDKSYVDYNVEYTDVYTGTEYKKGAAWRLLTDLSSYETAGTYTGNIEIISTGIPAKLYYSSSTVKNFESDGATVGKWAGNSTQRTQFLTDYNYPNRTTSDSNIYAAAGLLYNFRNIVFSKTGTTSTLTNSTSTTGYVFTNGTSDTDDTRNQGGYIEIKNGGTAVTASSTTTGEDLFVASTKSGTVEGIRSVNLKDIKGTNDDSNTTQITSSTDKRLGLFRFDQYSPEPVSNHGSSCYWLASPVGGVGNYVRYVSYNGDIVGNDRYPFGVRPVVSISNVKLKLNGKVWEIQE